MLHGKTNVKINSMSDFFSVFHYCVYYSFLEFPEYYNGFCDDAEANLEYNTTNPLNARSVFNLHHST